MLKSARTLRAAALIVAAASAMSAAGQEPFRISEIFFDGPGTDVGTVGGQPFSQIYIELKGQPGASLDDHYLIFLESENGGFNPSGIDNVFDLAGRTIGTNGYALLLPNGFNRPNQQKPGTAVYQNTDGIGFGEDGPFQHSSQGGAGDIENGSFSAYLIKKNTGQTPVIDTILDTNSDLLLDPAAIAGWTFLDQVGQSENDEPNARAFASPFFSQNRTTNTPATGTNVFTALEVEHLFRWGDSTGPSARDWAMANITNDPFVFNPAEYAEKGFLVSGNHVAANPLPGEMVRGLAVNNFPPAPNSQTGQRNAAPEGTVIQNNLGRANWPIPDGDLNQNEVVDQADLQIVLTNFGTTNPARLGHWKSGDPTGDGVVDLADLEFVIASFGRRVSVYEQRFNVAGAGPIAWTTNANWRGTVTTYPTQPTTTFPNASGAIANFTLAQAAATTITLNSSVTVGSLNLASPQPYSITGSGSIFFNNLSGATTLSAVSSNHIINVPVTFASSGYVFVESARTLTLPQGLVLNSAATLTKVGGGTLDLTALTGGGSLSILNGSIDVAAGSSAVSVGNLTIDTLGSLTLADNDLIVDYTGSSPLANLLANQLNGQLISDADFGGVSTLLVLFEAADFGLTEFGGVSLAGDAVLGKFTYTGDSNLDGQVDAFDYSVVDDNFGQSGSFITGDLNGDGIIDAFDYSSIDDTFGAGVGNPLRPSASTEVFIPEPSSLSLLALGGALLSRRRKTA